MILRLVFLRFLCTALVTAVAAMALAAPAQARDSGAWDERRATLVSCVLRGDAKEHRTRRHRRSCRRRLAFTVREPTAGAAAEPGLQGGW